MVRDRLVWATSFALVVACLVVGTPGCGGDNKVIGTVEVSAEQQQKTDEMLKNYGSQYNDMYRAKKNAKKAR